MVIDIKLIKVGKLHLAATQLGGIVVRGRSAAEPADAVRNLCWKLAGQDQDDDAKLAVELAANGVDLQAETNVPAITDGTSG